MAESNRDEIAKLEALYASNPGGRVFVHLAEAYRKAGEHDRARRVLTEGLAKHSDSASAYVVLGRVLADAGDGDEAATAFKRVLELDAGNLVALRWLGDLARLAGRTGEARSYYRDLLARNPSNQEVQELIDALDSTAATGYAAPVDDSDEPVSAAPGRAGAPELAEAEYGMVELDALPGDLGRLTGAASAPESAGASAADIIAAFEEEPEAQPFELGDTDPGLGAEPVDAHLLDAGLAADVEADEPTFDYEAVVEDAADAELALSTFELPAEPEVEYDDSTALDLSGFAESSAETEAAADFPTDLSAFIDAQQEEDEPSSFAVADLELEAAAAGVEDQELDGAVAGLTEVEFEPAAAGLEPAAAGLDVDFPGESTEDAASSELLEPIATLEEVLTATHEAAAAGDVTEEPEAELQGAAAEESEAEAAGAAFMTDPLQEAMDELAAERAAPAELFVAPDYLHAPEPVAPMEGVQAGYSEALGGPVAEDETEEPELATETMAELYLAQGYTERAAEVYRTLLRRRPDDARLRERLSVVEASMVRRRDVESLVEEDESGEVWLRGVGAVWTGTPAATEAATPYAWTEAPEEAAAAGEPVGNFLRGLVSWRRPAPSAAATVDTPPAAAEQEPLLLDETVDEAQADAWQMSPELPPTLSAPATPSLLAPPVPAPETAAPAPLPPLPAGSFGATRGANAVEAAFNEWYSGETPAAVGQPQAPAGPETAPSPATPAAWPPPASPVAAQAPAAVQPPGPTPTASQPLPERAEAPAPTLEPTSDDATDAEDEDLEMFRSWLQSLKK